MLLELEVNKHFNNILVSFFCVFGNIDSVPMHLQVCGLELLAYS